MRFKGTCLDSIIHHHHAHNDAVVELVNTFRWGPVVVSIGGLQEKVLDVVRWRNTSSKTTKHNEATSTERHLPVHMSHKNALYFTLCSWKYK